MAEANLSKRAALYTRVSTISQTCENQKQELLEVAARSGWEIVEAYADFGVSGSKGRRYRAGLDRLLKDAVRRKFDLVVVTGIDRLGRSLSDLLALLGNLRALRWGTPPARHRRSV
jgi:DNA invertase Pin-like site-specific DNA recombinase